MAWGFSSCDDDGNLSYIRYNDKGGVDRFTDNGDGGHSHTHWDKADDYNAGNDPTWYREESNHHGNPDPDKLGCYLTTACMQHFKAEFKDDCYELTVLRWFRDHHVEKKDIKLYYSIAPKIVEKINKEERKEEIYDYIYDNIVDVCVSAIEKRNYTFAYKRYKTSIVKLYNNFVAKNSHEENIKELEI